MDSFYYLGNAKRVWPMIKKIAIEGFKSFGAKTEMNLARITVIYGKNGRGKSSIVQPLLLLAQTMQEKGIPDVMPVNGRFVKLGVAEDLINKDLSPKKWTVELNSDSESLILSYSTVKEKPQLATISEFFLNGEDRFVSVASAEGSENMNIDHLKISVTTSDSSILQELKMLNYISSERCGPCNEVKLNDNLDPDNIGVKGETLINVIHNHGDMFARNVSEALSYVLDGGVIRTRREGDDRISLRINSADDEHLLFKPVNVGFGYSYVLPVIVASLLAKKGSMLILENPEAHLHPAAQSRLMDLIIKLAMEKNLQVVVETHSDHVVNDLRIARKNGEIERTDALILFVDHDSKTMQTIVEEIECDKNGTLSREPDDFLDEWTKQLLKLI